MTAAGGIEISGDAGAVVVNKGLVGGGVEAFSSVSDGTSSSAGTTLEVSTITKDTKGKGAATDSDVVTTTLTTSTSLTAVGGAASLTNTTTGIIGPDVLDGNSNTSQAHALVEVGGRRGRDHRERRSYPGQ